MKSGGASSQRYKKLFCLCCMVSYSNDHLHVCKGHCIRCLSMMDEHLSDDNSDEGDQIACGDCGRAFLQQFCYRVHKQRELNGLYANYCDFLASLLNCNKCRNNFSLCIKCSHFGKKRRRLENKQVFFSNNVSSSGPSKYVKCGYCSDFYLQGLSNSHNCFLRRSDSIFGDEKKRANMIHAQNVFYYDIESRLEERLECRFQETTESGDTVTVRKSVTLLPGLVNLHNLKEKLTERELKCMEVARCKSHQPTLLCVVNLMQSVKRHFCESECDNVITNFFLGS